MAHHRVKKSVSLFAGILISASGMAEEGDFMTVEVSGSLADAPECTIGIANQIEVDFGDEIIKRKVDGVNYREVINWPLVCQGHLSTALVVTIHGTPSSFNNDLLRTSTDGLGIRFYNESSMLKLGESVKFEYEAQPTLSAVPVADEHSPLKAGVFTGTATMIIKYQ